MTERVLLVEDDREVREALGQTLELAGLRPQLAGSYVAAKDFIEPSFDGVILSDVRMPGRDGFHLLEYARDADPELPVILLTGHGDIPMAVRGMAAGAFDFLEKPCEPEDLLAVVRKALETRGLALERRLLKRQAAAGDAASRMLPGISAEAEALRERVRAAAGTQAEALISGPQGSATSRVAEVIHMLSAASSGPFLKLPAACASGERLVRSFEEARGGTLFLDGAAALPPSAQYALIELIESASGARVLAGTCQDLEAELSAARFDADLYWRLDTLRVRVPSLGERPEDIPALFRLFLAESCDRLALPEPEVSAETAAMLMARDWPGNARELMNAAARYAIGFEDAVTEAGGGLSEQLARVERALLAEALRAHGGNATETARQLKLPRKTFYDKLTRRGLCPDEFRGQT